MFVPTGTPAAGTPLFQSELTRLPTTNQAPPSTATNAPSRASGRRALASTMNPPSTAARPGSISSHSLPVVYDQALSGV